jgi:chromate transporter
MDEVRHNRGTGAPAEVFRASLRLGLTAFGGPIAHLGYFERTYVQQLRWLNTISPLMDVSSSIPC